jgi:molybdopterin-binding protein
MAGSWSLSRYGSLSGLLSFTSSLSLAPLVDSFSPTRYNLPILPITMDVKLTRNQVAEMLHITPKTLATWERTGRIPTPERDWRGWRVYDGASIRAIRAELGLPTEVPADPTPLPTEHWQVSARNRLQGVVREITGDGVLCEVTLDLGNGNEIVSVITRSSAQRLGLAPGVIATALIKSTEVLLAR